LAGENAACLAPITLLIKVALIKTV